MSLAGRTMFFDELGGFRQEAGLDECVGWLDLVPGLLIRIKSETVRRSVCHQIRQ